MIMVEEQKSIRNRLIGLENNTRERSSSSLNNSTEQIQENQPFSYDSAPLMKIPKPIPCKQTLKRNIFANAIIHKNATKFIYDNNKNIMSSGSNPEISLNILQHEPFDELMINEQERKIYDELDQMGVRFADPIEIQNNYFQKIRSHIFSSDELSSDRFLTPKTFLSEKDLDNIDNSSAITATDLENSQASKSADLKFNDSKIYLKRSSFKRPAILEQYGINSKNLD